MTGNNENVWGFCTLAQALPKVPDIFRIRISKLNKKHRVKGVSNIEINKKMKEKKAINF